MPRTKRTFTMVSVNQDGALETQHFADDDELREHLAENEIDADTILVFAGAAIEVRISREPVIHIGAPRDRKSKAKATKKNGAKVAADFFEKKPTETTTAKE